MPGLDDAVALDPVNVDRLEGHRPFGRRDADELARLGARAGGSHCHPVAPGDDVFDPELKVREGLEDALDHLLERLAARLPAGGRDPVLGYGAVEATYV